MAAAEQDSAQSRYAQAATHFAGTGDFPVELICPITQTLMQDPVLTVQGNVYERAAITEWLQAHSTDPLTNAPLTALTLIPCNPIKSEIAAFTAAVRKCGPEAAAKLPADTSSASKQKPSAVSNAGGPSAAQPQLPALANQFPFCPSHSH